MTGQSRSDLKDGQRNRAAACWLARLESDQPLSAAERTEWEAWRSEPENLAAYLCALYLRSQVKSLPRLSLPTGQELRARFTEPPKAVAWGRVAWVVSTACAASLVALLAFRFFWNSYNLAADPGEVYTTAPGQQEAFKLPDGSVVTLAGASSLRVTMSLTRRLAYLDRGEARFQVQHDRWRPFTVFAGLGAITAVGWIPGAYCGG